jgi:RecA-family ATPase
MAELQEQTPDAGAVINVVANPEETKIIPLTPIYVRDNRFISVTDLFNQEVKEVMFLWENLMPAGSLATLAGPSDSGKTMLARQLCIAIANGDSKLLNQQLNLKYKKSIYVSTEDTKSDWVFKMQKLNLNEQEKEKIGSNMSIIVDYENIVQLLTKEFLTTPVDLVVLDVLPDLFTGDLNSTSHFRAFIKPFKALAAEYGTSFLFIHHLSKKGETNNTPSKINLLGASGIESSMRSVLELRKDQNDGTIRTLKVTKGNYVSEEFKKRVLKMQQRENFTYECIDFKAQPEKKHTDELIQNITELNKSGMTIRKMESKLNEDGVKIGRTKISEILNKIKQQKETVFTTKNQTI